MFPKFSEIQKLENQFLRVALYTAKGTERKALERAFPQCHSTDQNNLRVPVSILRRLAREEPETTDEYEDETWWDTTRVGIPTAFRWANYDSDDQCPPVPDEVLAQINNMPMRSGIIISYMSEMFIIVRILLSDANKSGTTIRRGNIALMVVVHSRFIDLNS